MSEVTVCSLSVDGGAGDEAAGGAAEAGGAAGAQLSSAQRARMERQRLRARALSDARLVHRHAQSAEPAAAGRRALDSGGGFLLEPERASEPAPPAAAPPAPLHAGERPACLECGLPFPHSYLFDTFEYRVCDECRDEEGAHSLMTRTEAKSEFLLKECDLDSRPPPLRALRRRNPHRGGADMRLYVRAQVEQRALEVWGSAAALQEERGRRAGRAARARGSHERRRLRALRLDVRSTLFAAARGAHRHAWGAERRLPDTDDTYERECTECGHKETYEKM